MTMTDKMYDLLTWIVRIVSPALCTMLVTLNSLWQWNLPIEAIVGTITAITTFIGIILGISSSNYKKGDDYKLRGGV